VKRKIKATIHKASDLNYKREKEFECAGKMLKWMRRTYNSWVLVFKYRKPDEVELWIYDDYME